MTIFPKRLQQEMFQEKKDKNFSMQVVNVDHVKANRPTDSEPREGSSVNCLLKVSDSSWEGTHP